MSDLLDNSIAAITRLRRVHPRVHCITNSVAQHFSANVLLACGAVPSMSVSEDEIEDFVSSSASLLINLGTMDPGRTRAVHRAVAIACAQKKPFALDPVFVQASKTRLELAKEIMAARPTIIRANRAEADVLFDQSNHCECVVISGPEDKIINENKTVQIGNGTPVMTQLTAMGCSLTALMAALLAVEDDAMVAAAAALLWFNIAGELAAEKSVGPGTFTPQFIDALATIDASTIEKRAKLLWPE